MRPKTSTLTERELGIMKIVWGMELATVRQVYEALRESGEKAAYTTVMTMMKILEEKGHLHRTLQGRAYVYAPVRPRTEVISGMVQEFVDRVFNGSARPLVQNLIEDRRLTEEEIAEITRAVRDGESS